jgi:hypothetical protein
LHAQSPQAGDLQLTILHVKFEATDSLWIGSNLLHDGPRPSSSVSTARQVQQGTFRLADDEWVNLHIANVRDVDMC